jgi:hypothetical protein
MSDCLPPFAHLGIEIVQRRLEPIDGNIGSIAIGLVLRARAVGSIDQVAEAD